MISAMRLAGVRALLALCLASLAVAARAEGVVEQALPPPDLELWPWIVLMLVVFASAAVFSQWVKTGPTPHETRDVDSFEAWSKTEQEIAPRAHIGARLPGRDAAPRSAGKPGRTTSKPAPAFGRRS